LQVQASVQHRRFTPWQLVPRVTQFTFSMTAPCEKERCDHVPRAALRTPSGVMTRAKMARPGWSCASEEAGIVIYSILVLFLMLSWAYIPA
jgi:hypothetical protein